MRHRSQLLDYSKPWSYPNLYVFTGNTIRRNDGGLVMGRGAAKQVRDSWPGIDRQIEINEESGFAVTMIDRQRHQCIGWFQVKHHWKDQASLDLIKRSTQTLSFFAIERPDLVIHMNYPGVGNGRLDERDVENIVDFLPDNVILYR